MLVVLHCDIVDLVGVDRVALLELQLRERERVTAELLLHLLEVIRVDVRVAARPDEVTHLQSGLLRHHVRQQCVGRDVERHTEEHIRAALIHLAAQLAIGHVELEQHVARLQSHVRQIRDVPG